MNTSSPRAKLPLRRTLILDQKLQFPEGVATAEVLKVGQDPGRGLKALSLAAATGPAAPKITVEDN